MTGQFASRRERKLYETGAISLPSRPLDRSGSAGPAVVVPASSASSGSSGSSTDAATTRPNALPSQGRSTGLGSKRRAGLALRILAALVALAGLVVLVLGGLKATVWAPTDVVVGTLGAHSQKLVTTEIGALALAGPRVQIQVSGAGSDQVFVGIGRAADVDAYLADAATDRVVGLNRETGALLTRVEGSDPAGTPDPAAADVWTVSELGSGSAGLTWPDPASGQWRMVIATDGTHAAPPDVTLTWTGGEVSNPAPAWIAVGIVLLVAGVITSMMLRARARDRRRA